MIGQQSVYATNLWYRIRAVDICSYTPKYADHAVNFKNKCTTSKLLYLSCNQRRTHTARFLCCFAVKIASNIEACAHLSSAIFCRHCRDVRSDVCHGSTISSADFLRKLSHAHKSWPTWSIVWLLLKEQARRQGPATHVSLPTARAQNTSQRDFNDRLTPAFIFIFTTKCLPCLRNQSLCNSVIVYQLRGLNLGFGIKFNDYQLISTFDFRWTSQQANLS